METSRMNDEKLVFYSAERQIDLSSNVAFASMATALTNLLAKTDKLKTAIEEQQPGQKETTQRKKDAHGTGARACRGNDDSLYNM